MIPNCRGCKEELSVLYDYFKDIEKGKLHFAGFNLYEKGHFNIILVDNKGEIAIG